jgi:hypothetical protein
MNEKITKESINCRLITELRNIEMTGSYLGSLSQTQFRCNNGHEWQATPNKVLNYKSGCPSCHHNNISLINTDKFIQKLSFFGIKLIDKYVNRQTEIKVCCSNGHEWTQIAGYISECKKCSGRRSRRLSTSIINERLKNDGREIIMIDEYVNAHTSKLFRCLAGHEWNSNPNNIIRGSGCPTCSPGGFNQNKPAHVYVLSFGTYIKYGITNRLKKRLDEYKRYGKYELVISYYFENGQKAKEWENNIKSIFGGYYVDNHILPIGHTETLSISFLTDLINTLTNE